MRLKSIRSSFSSVTLNTSIPRSSLLMTMSWSKKIVRSTYSLGIRRQIETPSRYSVSVLAKVRWPDLRERTHKANVARFAQRLRPKGDVRPSSLGLARLRAHLSRARPAVGGGPRRATRVGGVVLSGCPASCLGVFWRLPGIAVQSPS